MICAIETYQLVGGDWAFTIHVGAESFTDSGYLLKGYAYRAAQAQAREIRQLLETKL